MERTRLLAIVSIAALSLALTGCPERRRIGDITSDPSRYYDKEVTIIGRVTKNSWGAFTGGVYEVDDGTGKIWVVTEKHGAPSKDAYVGVTGRILPSATFEGRNFATVLHETQRRTRPKK